MIPTMRLLVCALLAGTARGKESSYTLASDHESFEWRRKAGRPTPDMNKVVVWTRHEQVGIGNAFGGFARVMQDALEEDRTLVIYSLIFEKFCAVVPCAMRQIPDEGYLKRKGGDVTKASHFQIQLSNNRRAPLKESPWFTAAGCWDPPVSHGSPPRDFDWPPMCMYSKLVRSFVTGGTHGGRLEAESSWLQKFFVGDSDRFHAVTSVDKNRPTPVYDVVIHIRTLALIEDMSTEDGIPLDAKAKSEKFIASAGFQSMVRCFAHKIAQGVIRKHPPQPDFSGAGKASTNSAPLKSRKHKKTMTPGVRSTRTKRRRTKRRRLTSSTEERHAREGLQRVHLPWNASSAPPATNATTTRTTVQGPSLSLSLSLSASRQQQQYQQYQQQQQQQQRRQLGSLPTGGEGGESKDSDEKLPKVLSVYLATDAPHVREAFAKRLTSEVEKVLNEAEVEEKEGHFARSRREEVEWAVEVDYFKATLPPAHFFIWTYPMKDMKKDDWQALVGTTAEWLFMSQGRRMLTVKGLGGGEKALPSSFALSAAAFGRTSELLYLQSSGQAKGGQSAPFSDSKPPTCNWLGIASFS